MLPTYTYGTQSQQQLWQQPYHSPATNFWQSNNIHEHVQKLKATIDISKALLVELEEIVQGKLVPENIDEDGLLSNDYREEILSSSLSTSSRTESESQCIQMANRMKISQDVEESVSIEAAKSLCSHLEAQIASIAAITSKKGSWEDISSAVCLAQKLSKAKRNKRWRKQKKKHISQLLAKEHAEYDKVDKEADEWRAREIAKDIAKRKMENMKEIAKKKANEERKRLESELELVVIVEKLQELRSIRISKMKKQGHFLPDEDDKFLNQVKAAVEEEERQAATAARTDAARDAIVNAEVSRKATAQENDIQYDGSGSVLEENQTNGQMNQELNEKVDNEEKTEGKGDELNESLSKLPFEFYHYYHGANNDMGTLIEVRRTWDAYLRPGGSRIPGHWVQPPPPADEVWASYLVPAKQKL